MGFMGMCLICVVLYHVYVGLEWFMCSLRGLMSSLCC